MDRREDSLGRRRLPIGLVGMVALIVLVEAAIGGRPRDLTGGGAAAWRWAARSARVDAPGSEILCFGDSLLKHALAPKIVAAETGRKVRNLAVPAGRPATSYFLLRRALDAGARPSAIVLDAYTLSEEPLETPQVWAELATPIEAAGAAREGRDPAFFARYAAAWLLPSVRARFEIRQALLAAFRGESSGLRDRHDLNLRNWKANGGASIIPAVCRLTSDSVQFLANPPAKVPGRWEARPENVAYLDRFLDLADRHGIPVFWVYPPHHRLLDRYFDKPNWGGRYRQVALDRLALHPNLTIIDGIHADYDESTMADVSHMNRRGAVAFSLALGAILRDRLAAPGPRRVELPAFREPPALATVEDHEQSRLAVQAEASRRR